MTALQQHIEFIKQTIAEMGDVLSEYGEQRKIAYQTILNNALILQQQEEIQQPNY